MSEGKLTNKQRRFCEEYVVDWNATRAAKAAGYSEKTAYSIGQENLNKPEILTYIKEIQKDLAKLAGVSALRNAKELAKIAYSTPLDTRIDWDTIKDLSDLTEGQRASISEVYVQRRVMIGNEGEESGVVEQIKVKHYDKQKAIEILNKMFGWNAPEKKEIQSNLDIPISKWLESMSE